MRQSEPSHVEVTSLPHALFPLFSSLSLSLSEKPLGRGWCCQRVLSVSLRVCVTVAKRVSVSHASRWWLLRHTRTRIRSYRSTIRPQRTVRMMSQSPPSSRYRAGRAKQAKREGEHEHNCVSALRPCVSLTLPRSLSLSVWQICIASSSPIAFGVPPPSHPTSNLHVHSHHHTHTRNHDSRGNELSHTTMKRISQQRTQ